MSTNKNQLLCKPKRRGYTKNSKTYSPNTYVSIQERVNNDTEFRCEYFKKLIAEGWKELDNPRDIEKIKPGIQIKYILNGNSLAGEPAGTFRSGGFYQGVGDNKEFMYYKGFNGCSFTLQFKDLQALYVKSLN